MPIDPRIALGTQGFSMQGNPFMDAFRMAFGVRQANENLELQRTYRDQQRQQMQADLDKRQRENAINQGADRAFSSGKTGNDLLAHVAATDPQSLPFVTEFINKDREARGRIDKAQDELRKAHLDRVGHVFDGILTYAKTDDQLPGAIYTAAGIYGDGLSPQEQAQVKQQAQQLLQMSPAEARRYMEAQRSQSPYWQERQQKAAERGPTVVGPGSTVLRDGQAPYTAPKEPTKPTSAQEYEYAQSQGYQGTYAQYQNEDANRKLTGSGQGAKPYFTYQPTYDAQGRPTGAIRFDARGGKPEFIDVGSMTGGGQLKPPPGDLGKQSITNEVSLDQLDRLQSMFDGGAKALIGPAAGRARELGQAIPGVEIDSKFVEFDAASAAFKNAVIKAITGAQMSEAEAARISRQIPQPTDKPDVWQAKATQTRKNLADLEARLKTKRPTDPSSGTITITDGKGHFKRGPAGATLPDGWTKWGG
jgi:hypothetical protein